jgi:transcriptional regulator with XRE-family HTH domain
MDVRVRVGLNVQQARRERGLSQEELAHRAAVHQTYLSGVERGTRNPTVVVLDRIAQALDLDPVDLLRRRDGERS